MLSVDRPVGSIPLGFGAIRPAWVDFASGSSRRFDSTWGSPRFVPQGSISLVIRPVGFDFTGFWMRFVPHGSISLVSRPVGSISLGFGRDSSRRFDFAVESTRRVRSRCPQFANRPVGFDFARVRQAKFGKARAVGLGGEGALCEVGAPPSTRGRTGGTRGSGLGVAGTA